MSIRLLPTGELEFDSVQEAREYMGSSSLKIATENAPQSYSEIKNALKNSVNRVIENKRQKPTKLKISQYQRDVINEIIKGGNDWCSTIFLMKKLGLRKEQIGPVFRGIHINLRRLGLKPNSVIQQSMNDHGEKCYRFDSKAIDILCKELEK